MRVKTVTAALLCACAVAPSLFGTRASARAASSPVIREAPAAPVFKEEERHAELRARRERVAAKLGPNSLLVLFSAEPRLYTNDVDYEFRQENNLYYLTALRQKGATLVMLTGAQGPAREILFLPRRNPATETWDGRMYSPEDARAASGVGEIWDARQFEPFMSAVRARRAFTPAPEAVMLAAAGAQAFAPALENLYAAMAKNEATLHLLLNGEGNREFAREQAFAAEWAGANSGGFSVRSAWNIFAELRMRKSPYELRLMQHAVDISIEGHQRAQAVAARAQWEYEVEAELDYTYKRRNADNWGYPSIVGCGPNGTTLHYQESQGRVRPGDLILIDAGAEYEHYSADVTRTFPASGKFTTAQAEVYNVVLAAQEAAFAVIKPGAEFPEVHNAATEVIKDGLLRLGLITEKNSLQYRVWYMHGTSHWLGMNVHDVSTRATKLDAGMVFTVEPGIYVRPDALDNLPKTPENEKFIAAVRPAFEKYKGVGVRIEDDVVVTPEGYRNLSVALPRTVADVEAFIARAQKEVRVGLLLPRRWRSAGRLAGE